MKQKDAYWYTQSGAIPYRIINHTTNGAIEIEILLITSRKRKRWIIPKGIVEPGMTPYKSAEKEAVEEAGVLGDVSTQALGSYQHQKWGGTCEIEVFPLHVKTLLEEWPEMQIRQRKWMSVNKARNAVRHEDLKHMIVRLPEMITARKGSERDEF